MNIIEKITISYLLGKGGNDKIFFANLLVLLEKHESTSVPTMGVTIENGSLHLYYNPKFVQSLVDAGNTKVLKGLLEHELLHLVYEHPIKAVKLNRIHYIYNLASDIAINQLISRDLLPSTFKVKVDGKILETGILLPEQWGLPKLKDSEFYYHQLLKNTKSITLGINSKDSKQNKRGTGSVIDDHSGWKKVGANSHLAKEVIKQAVKEAYENTKKSRGVVPGYLEEKINQLLAPPTISWNRILRQYVASSIKYSNKRTWKRPNRRLPSFEELKGKTSNKTVRLLLAIDTSGSVDNKDFNDFLNEIRGIMNIYKLDIDAIQCDVEITSKEKFKRYSNLKVKFKGRGGTSYKPVFDYLKKNKQYDLLIYFTDLYCDFERCNAVIPVIWVCTKQGNIENKPPFGRLVQIGKSYKQE